MVERDLILSIGCCLNCEKRALHTELKADLNAIG